MNKKIKNATIKEYDNIEFKSNLEVMVYKTLKEEEFTPEYETKKYILWKGFKPTIPFYDKCKTTKELKLNTKKIIDTTYTPDFTFTYNNKFIIIEAKGKENDVFPIKKKLFRKYLEENIANAIYFEIFNKKQLLQAIKIIKNEES